MWCSVTGAYSKRQLSLHITTVYYYYYYYHHEKSYLWKRSIFIRRDEIIRCLQITTSGYSTDSESQHHCWATSQNNYGACWMSPLLHNGLRDAPKLLLPREIRGPHLMHSSMGPSKSTQKRHLDRLSRISTAQGSNHQIHRETGHATSVTTGHILRTVMQCNR